jgi:hypothetical protein
MEKTRLCVCPLGGSQRSLDISEWMTADTSTIAFWSSLTGTPA